MRQTFDEAWRRRALAGEPAAVRSLAEAVLEPLHSFVFYRVGKDRHLCEEIVQETLLRAIRDLDRYDPDRAAGDVFPWLTGLARNEIQRVLSRRKSAVSLEALWERMDRELLAVYRKLETEPIEGELLEREETREMVNTTMSQIPPHYRRALEAKYVLGKSVREIAAALAVSEKAVESTLSRAREAFRATFLALARNLEPIV
ncbi:MAG: sigma-70 family RNA polymerase sigma factor [Planctomycetes bacterium]|nr:sigma-70 family RNA polymerase sigma factor [Planctomycetota bacterium]